MPAAYRLSVQASVRVYLCLCPAPAALQDVELYLTKESREAGFTLVARSGRVLQELLVDTSLSKDAMKKALTRVLSRVR